MNKRGDPDRGRLRSGCKAQGLFPGSAMRRVSSVRERTPSLWYTRERLASTVFMEMKSASATSRLVLPSATRSAIRRSVGLRPAGCADRTPVRLSPASAFPFHRGAPTQPGAISSAARQVCQLPTRIVLSYLMLWAQRSRAQAWPAGDTRSHGAGQRAGAVTYI